MGIMVDDLANHGSSPDDGILMKADEQLENYLMSDTLLTRMYDDWKPVLVELDHFHEIYRRTKRKGEKISWDVAKRIIPCLTDLKCRYKSFLSRNPALCKSIEMTINTYKHYGCGKRTSKKGSSGKELAKDLEMFYEELIKSMRLLVA